MPRRMGGQKLGPSISEGRHVHAKMARVIGSVREHCDAERSPGADLGRVSPVPKQMWQGECGPGADVACAVWLASERART